MVRAHRRYDRFSVPEEFPVIEGCYGDGRFADIVGPVMADSIMAEQPLYNVASLSDVLVYDGLSVPINRASVAGWEKNSQRSRERITRPFCYEGGRPTMTRLRESF